MLPGKKPRILFAANLYPEHNFMMQRYDGILVGLDGYTVAFMDIFDFFGDHERAMELESVCFDGKRLREYFNTVDIVSINESWLRQVLSYEWDILCLCTISHYSYFLLPDTLRRLSGKDKLVVGFFGDDETMFSHHKYWTGMFDAVVAYSEREVRSYQQSNSHTYLLPIGVGKLPEISREQTKDIDVIFVGRPYGKRVELIRAVKGAGINIQVFGSKSWLAFSDLKDVYHGFLERDVFWQHLARAKIVLNLMEDISGDKPHINAKVFEAAMVASLPVVTYYPPFETTYRLENGKNIVFYQSIEDLVAQIKHYLTHDSDRERIAYGLQQHLLLHFAYKDLYRDLFSNLDAQWRASNSESAFRLPRDASLFSVIQFVNNELDCRQASHVWSLYSGLHVIYVSQTGFRASNVYSLAEFSHKLGAQLSQTIRDYVIFSTPYAVYDPITFNLLARYGASQFFRDGVYCDSVLSRKRLHKSLHLLDLGSSIWRREDLLEHAQVVLRWYRLLGPIMPRRLAKFNLSLMPVFLNTIPAGRTASPLDLYRRVVDIARRLKRS